MKRILLFSFVFILVGQAGNIKNKENRMITLDHVKVKYINFIPKNIDKTCLDRKIETLFSVLLSVKKAKEMERKIPSKEYFSKKYEKQRQEIKELSGQLLIKKHISYKGNHEWRNIVSGNYLVIESEKNHIYVMYPLEPKTFMISGKSFDDVKDNEGLMARELKDWIDMKKCIQY